jgi:hypothetical protein
MIRRGSFMFGQTDAAIFPSDVIHGSLLLRMTVNFFKGILSLCLLHGNPAALQHCMFVVYSKNG